MSEPTRVARLIRPNPLIVLALTIGGCAQLSAAQMATSAIGTALEAVGVLKKGPDEIKVSRDFSVKIFADDQLNLSQSRKALSLVIKLYVLRP